MPQLDFANYPFISQIFWLALSFFVLYIYSAKIILPRISKTIEMRDRTIKTALTEAETAKKQLEENNESNEVLLSGARLKSRDLIKQTQSEIDKKSNLAQSKTDAIIAEKINDCKINIEKLKENSKKEISTLTENIYNNLLKNYL
jgi:F-type H+-transporting ATPase subunit b